MMVLLFEWLDAVALWEGWTCAGHVSLRIALIGSSERLTEDGMDNIVLLEYIHRVVSRVFDHFVEINTLMWCCLVHNRL